MPLKSWKLRTGEEREGGVLIGDSKGVSRVLKPFSKGVSGADCTLTNVD